MSMNTYKVTKLTPRWAPIVFMPFPSVFICNVFSLSVTFILSYLYHKLRAAQVSR